MTDEPRPLAEHLKTGAIARLLEESARRRTATAELKRSLPPDEAAHLVSAATEADGTLVLVMDSPQWAARMRYAIAALPHARVKIRVSPRGA